MAAVAQHEPAGRAERDRCDQDVVGGGRAEFGFVVGVPAHGVPAVPVEVGEHGVEVRAERFGEAPRARPAGAA
jgi:hypothetical protein